jgi:hypothetical protein
MRSQQVGQLDDVRRGASHLSAKSSLPRKHGSDDLEGRALVTAYRKHNSQDCDGDGSDNEAILDGGGTGLVFGEADKEIRHFELSWY